MNAFVIPQRWSLLHCQLHGQRREQEVDTGVSYLLEIFMSRHTIRVIALESPTKASLLSNTLA